MKRKILPVILVLVLFSATMIGTMGAAYAKGGQTFTNSYSGKNLTSNGTKNTEADRTTTLNYSKNHKSFNLNIKVERNWKGISFANTKYTIKMYDSKGKCVWTEKNQQARTYYVGSNVTKIVIITNSHEYPFGLTVYWQKK